MRTRQGRLRSFCSSVPRTFGILCPAGRLRAPMLHAAEYRRSALLSRRLSATAASPRTPCSRASFRTRAILRRHRRRARFQLALEHRLLRRHPHRARRHRQVRELLIFVREKPTIAAIDYKGLNAVTAVRRAGALQEGKSRSLRGEPVRPHAHQACRGRTEGDAGRTRPPVRHHPDRSEDASRHHQ